MSENASLKDEEYLMGSLLGFQIGFGILLRFLDERIRVEFINEARKATEKARKNMIKDGLPDRGSDGVVDSLALLIREAESDGV